MTLSPFELALWLLAGQGRSVGKLGESGPESLGTGLGGALSDSSYNFLAEILKIHCGSFMERKNLEKKVIFLFFNLETDEERG